MIIGNPTVRWLLREKPTKKSVPKSDQMVAKLIAGLQTNP
jgi:hypothetical protein